MHRSHPDVKILGLLCLESLLVCSLGSCAQAPTYYWVKFGVSQEQVRKENFSCADMAAEKRDNYIRRREMFVPVDQATYRQCMTSRGYQMVTKQELEQGVLPLTPAQSLAQEIVTQKMCDRVVGKAGGVNSCVRWMSLKPNGNVPPIHLSELHDWLEQQNFRTSTGKGETNFCFRHDPNDTNKLLVTTNKSCDSTESESP
jgi:hypothetical protein